MSCRHHNRWHGKDRGRFGKPGNLFYQRCAGEDCVNRWLPYNRKLTEIRQPASQSNLRNVYTHIHTCAENPHIELTMETVLASRSRTLMQWLLVSATYRSFRPSSRHKPPGSLKLDSRKFGPSSFPAFPVPARTLHCLVFGSTTFICKRKHLLFLSAIGS